MPKSNHVIVHDKWDTKAFMHTKGRLPDIDLAVKYVSKFASKGLVEACVEDLFYALYRVLPRLLDESEIATHRLVNHFVLEEIIESVEFVDLNFWTKGNQVNCSAMIAAFTKQLAIIFDKLRAAQREADAAGIIEGTIEELKKAMTSEMVPELERLEKELSEKVQNMHSEIESMIPSIRESNHTAFANLKESQEGIETLEHVFSDTTSKFGQADPTLRAEIAALLAQNPGMQRIATLLGRMQKLAMECQDHKVQDIKSQKFTIGSGDNLPRVLASELVLMSDEDHELSMLERYTEKRLLQLDEDRDQVIQGNIVVCEDASGSMSGGAEIWAKGVAGSLLSIAKRQGRNFTAIQFGGRGELQTFDFSTRGATITDGEHVEELTFAEGGLRYMSSVLWGSGTDFETPLGKVLSGFEQEFVRNGQVRGDVVFITDGMADISPAFMDYFKERQTVLQFKVYGVQLGCYTAEEPLVSLCDGGVFTVDDFTDAQSIAQIFGSV